MDQDQQEKQRHVCKYCNKSFANGKVLGGHMRCHVTKNPLKNQKKLINNNNNNNNDDDDTALVNEGGERAGYGLRVNPKKSSRVSASSDQETTSSSKELPCGVCGKGFDSMRALFGHMRHHSKRRREMVCCCRECGREFESLRALSCHVKSHSSDSKRGLMEKRLFAESSGLVKRKRSRRSRLKFRANCSVLSLSESSSTFGGDVDREAEEIAVCLLMLSKGVWSHDEFCSAEFSEDANSSGLEAKSLNRGKGLLENGDASMSKKLRIDQRLEFGIGSGCEGGFLDGKKPWDSSENGEEKEGLSLGVSDPKSGGDLGMMRVMIINPLEMESDESLAKSVSGEKPGLDQDSAGQLGLIDSGPETLESYQRRSEYKCRTCNKIFHSHQALGGHQTIHRSAKSFPSWQFDDFPGIEAEDSVELEAERVVTVTSFETNKEHKCHICFKVFASGQALGGHKRAHTVRDSEAEEAEKIPLMSHEVCGISEHVLDTEVELKSSSPWWVRNSHKHELLVGLMPN